MVFTGRITWGAAASSFFPQDHVAAMRIKIRPAWITNAREKMILLTHLLFITIAIASSGILAEI